MEGKESGFRSLESIWTEDGGSGGHGRGGTGRCWMLDVRCTKDAEVQDGQSHIGRGLEGVIYFQRPKARAKVVKKSIYTNKKHPKTCTIDYFVVPL